MSRVKRCCPVGEVRTDDHGIRMLASAQPIDVQIDMNPPQVIFESLYRIIKAQHARNVSRSGSRRTHHRWTDVKLDCFCCLSLPSFTALPRFNESQAVFYTVVGAAAIEICSWFLG